MAAVIAFILIALTIGFIFVPGIGWFLSIATAIGAVVAILWAFGVLSVGRTPGGIVRERGRADRPELLGPGGPDDPDRAL